MTLHAQTPFKPGFSNPLLDVSKHYGVDYGAVLLYADSLRRKEYDNSNHELAAFNELKRKFSGDPAQTEFHASVQEVVARLG